LTEVKHQDHASQRTPMSFLKSQHEPDFSLLHNQAPKGTQTQGPRRPRFPSSIYQTCQRAADACKEVDLTRNNQVSPNNLAGNGKTPKPNQVGGVS
jgi:hypothetical protein